MKRKHNLRLFAVLGTVLVGIGWFPLSTCLAVNASYSDGLSHVINTTISFVDVSTRRAEVQSAQARVENAQASVTRLTTLVEHGVAAQKELEDARRQYASAQDNAIVAARDRALAWVALVRAAGQAPTASTLTSELTAIR